MPPAARDRAPGHRWHSERRQMATMLANSLRADRVGALRLREVCKAEPADPVEQVVRCMTEGRSGCVLVHRDGELVGIFTERDFVNRVVTQGMDCARPVESVMTADPATVSI